MVLGRFDMLTAVIVAYQKMCDGSWEPWRCTMNLLQCVVEGNCGPGLRFVERPAKESFRSGHEGRSGAGGRGSSKSAGRARLLYGDNGSESARNTLHGEFYMNHG